MSDLISRQAAIDAVRNYLLECQIEDGDYHADGIMYELDCLPSVHPNTTGTTTATTTDCISRQAAIEKTDCLYRDTKNDEAFMITGYNHALSDMRAILKSLPSVQPDMSEYSDRLWKLAYERGKRDAYTEMEGAEYETD